MTRSLPRSALGAVIALTLAGSVVAAFTVAPEQHPASAHRAAAPSPSPSATPTTGASPSPSAGPPAGLALHVDASYVLPGDPALTTDSTVALVDAGVVFSTTPYGTKGTDIQLLTTATGKVSTLATVDGLVSSLDADGTRVAWSSEPLAASTGAQWRVSTLQLGHPPTTAATGTGDTLPPEVHLRGTTLTYLRRGGDESLHLRSLDGSRPPADVAHCFCFIGLSSTGIALPTRDGVALERVGALHERDFPATDLAAIGLSTTHVAWIQGHDEAHQTVRSADISTGKTTTLDADVDRENVGLAQSALGVGTGFDAWVETRGLVVHAVPASRETVVIDSGADPVFSVRDHRVAYIGRTSDNRAVVEVATVSP